jgi:hypothetical protein
MVLLSGAYLFAAAFRNALTSRPPFPENGQWPVIPPIALVVAVATHVAIRILRPRLPAEPAHGNQEAVQEQSPDPRCLQERLTDESRTLDEQWTWVRDRVGQAEWRRLIGLRDAWITLSTLGSYAILATIGVGVLALLGVIGASSLGGRVRWENGLHQPVLVLPPVAALVCWLGRGVLRRMMSRRYGELVLQGRNPEAIDRALWANYQSQRLAKHSKRIIAEESCRQPAKPARPWWRVELSGAHLLLWCCVPVIAYTAHARHAPEWVSAVGMFGAIAWVFKVCFLLLLLLAGFRPDTWPVRAYRWCATLTGTVVALVFVPAGFLLVGGGMSWLIDVFSR